MVSAISAPLSEVADEHFAAIRNGDVDGAYAMTSQTFREVTSREDFRQFLDASPILQTVTGVSFNSTEIENNTAKASGSLKTDSGERIEVTVEFIKDSGDWKINSIHFPGS